jgi:hypothetical protein
MELIPILSTIILVATISTFLLAIGAYILYKVRERRGQIAVAPHEAEIRAEVVTPAGIPAPRQVEQQRPALQPIYVDRQPVIIQQAPGQSQQRVTQRPQPYTAFRQQTAVSTEQQPGQYNEAGFVQQRGFQVPRNGNQPEEAKQQKDSKFLKYTTEGYVSTKENKESGAVRWR